MNADGAANNGVPLVGCCVVHPTHTQVENCDCDCRVVPSPSYEPVTLATDYCLKQRYSISHRRS